MASKPDQRKRGAPRKYTEDERRNAARLMADASRTIQSIADETGIPVTSLYRFAAEFAADNVADALGDSA